MRIKLTLLFLLCLTLPTWAQTEIKGIVVNAQDGKPVANADVMIQNQQLSTTTDATGSFLIKNVESGADMLQVVAFGFEDVRQDIAIIKGRVNDLGVIRMDVSGFDSALLNSNDFIFDEEQIDSDEGLAQNVGTIQGATDDIYYQASSYNFSPLYFRHRGLDNSWQSNYINGINFNDPMRGSFSYSSLGGLTSTAFRNKTVDIALDDASYALGSIGGQSNYNTYASYYAPGFKGALSYTNSNYMLRAMLSYASGVTRNGWAVSASIIGRYAPEGVVEGTWYNSFGYALSVQKIFNEKHSLNLTTWGAPTQRATAQVSTQEAYDLAGSNLYNPSWGWFNGKKRSARVNTSFDPSVVLNWIWRPRIGTTINTGLGYRHNAYAQTRLNYYGYSTNPDYYRNMPSFYLPTAEEGTALYDAQLEQYNYITALWRNDQNFRQIQWDTFYQSNLQNNENFDRDPQWRGQSTTILEDNHSNFSSWMLNSAIDHKLNSTMKLQGGVSFNYSDAHYFKTMADLLGGEFWRDIDTYSERDFGSSTDVLQNDMRYPNRKIYKGDVFGYDYNIRMIIARVWLQNQIETTHWNINYGLDMSYTNFVRHGNMQNGRAPENSLGDGQRHDFDNAMVKAGATYKLDGRNYFTAHVAYGSRAPRPYDSYVSARIKDTAVTGLKSERFFSGDISYTWNYNRFRGSVTGFLTHTWDGMRHTGFYDYDLKSFMNYSISGMEMEYKGVEVGMEYAILSNLSATFAGTFSRYQYKNNPMGVRSYENGAEEDVERQVFLKNYFVGCTPQQAYTLGLKYNISRWFFEVRGSYMCDNYYDVSYSRHEEMPGLWKFCSSEEEYVSRRDEITRQDKLKNAFVMALSVGKVLYTRFGSVNFNLSVDNLLNNRDIQVRGWQDGKFDYTNYNVNKYPNKVAYAQGIRVFFNVGIRF